MMTYLCYYGTTVIVSLFRDVWNKVVGVIPNDNLEGNSFHGLTCDGIPWKESA